MRNAANSIVLVSSAFSCSRGFRVFAVFAVFAFCCPFSRFRVFARKCRASPKAETHTFPAQLEIECIIVFAQKADWDAHHHGKSFYRFDGVGRLVSPPFFSFGDVVSEGFSLGF